MPKTDITKIPRPIKRDYRKTEYAENCSPCMYSHKGTCGFDYCHVAYSKALRRYDAVIGLPRDTGHYKHWHTQQRRHPQQQGK